ncbi:hypothetical protein HYH03_002160 [Edaphochlamys debaryana]|uniref:Uncharacterized protein n=1 Tax=Edaphochlamys debaryana TaxID=47281 RepID=A0A836C5I3_9CHLO|nr:hypothetical protein HYH03_002160 [Edaphochlamys debaryana]|eukprot:KAG2499869.1 hypothetical protein HYH03_002160 [Edaphochlamys debaryana]
MQLSVLQRCGAKPAQISRRGGVAPAPIRGQFVVKAQKDDFMATVKAVAKRVQGSLPIVGLVSRWAAPEGGFDEVAYPEFARAMIERVPVSYRIAQQDFEKLYGKPANSRWVMLVLWMATQGPGLVAPKDVISAARRLRITQDIEIEVERFETAKEVTLKKYNMINRPEGKLEDKLGLAVDALCTLCIGVKDGEPVPEAGAPLVREIVRGAFPDASEAQVAAAVANRTARAATY